MLTKLGSINLVRDLRSLKTKLKTARQSSKLGQGVPIQNSSKILKSYTYQPNIIEFLSKMKIFKSSDKKADRQPLDNMQQPKLIWSMAIRTKEQVLNI